MKAQLFIDSFRSLFTNFQASTIKLINKPSPLSHKIQDLSLNLLQLKTTILKTYLTIFQQISQQEQNKYEQLQQKITRQHQETNTKLNKLQLHAFLKKKLKKLHRESMMHSISQIQQGNQQDHSRNLGEIDGCSYLEDPNIGKLKNNLGIEQFEQNQCQRLETSVSAYSSSNYHNNNSRIFTNRQSNPNNTNRNNYEEELRSVIHKSMTSLQITPIRRSNNGDLSDTSMRMDDQYMLHENCRVNGQVRIREKQIVDVEKQKDKEKGKERQISKSKEKQQKKFQIVKQKDGIVGNSSVSNFSLVGKQMERKTVPTPVPPSVLNMEKNKQKISTNTANSTIPNNIANAATNINANKNKGKKAVYSNINSNAKDKMGKLDNLLEESLQTYFSTAKKQ